MVMRTFFDLYAPEVALEKTIAEIKQAIAWGQSDGESTGYTAKDYAVVLHLALRAIEELKK